LIFLIPGNAIIAEENSQNAAGAGTGASSAAAVSSVPVSWVSA